MKSRRVAFFVLTIILGIAAGLAFGWLVMPPRAPVGAAMDKLRVDYQTDLVLMVAEFFQSNPDSLLALNQLSKLTPHDPLTLIGSSLAYGAEIGYQQQDLLLMENLLMGIDPEVYQQWLEESETN